MRSKNSVNAKGRSFAFASSHFRRSIFTIWQSQPQPTPVGQSEIGSIGRHPHSFIDAEINLHVDLRCFFRVFHNGFRKKYVLYVINYFRKVPQCPKF